MTGSLTQSASGTFRHRHRPAATSDRINVSDTADLAGKVAVTLTSLPTTAAQSYSILQALSGVTDNGLGLIASPALHATLTYPNATDVVLGIAVDFTVDGLNPNQRAIADNLDQILFAGVGTLGPALLGLLNVGEHRRIQERARSAVAGDLFRRRDRRALFEPRLLQQPVELQGQRHRHRFDHPRGPVPVGRRQRALPRQQHDQRPDRLRRDGRAVHRRRAGGARRRVAARRRGRLSVEHDADGDRRAERRLAGAGRRLAQVQSRPAAARRRADRRRRLVRHDAADGIRRLHGRRRGQSGSRHLLGSVPRRLRARHAAASISSRSSTRTSRISSSAASPRAAATARRSPSTAAVIRCSRWRRRSKPAPSGGWATARWCVRSFAPARSGTTAPTSRLTASFAGAPLGVSPFTINTDIDEVMGLIGAGVEVINGGDAVLAAVLRRSARRRHADPQRRHQGQQQVLAAAQVAAGLRHRPAARGRRQRQQEARRHILIAMTAAVLRRVPSGEQADQQRRRGGKACQAPRPCARLSSAATASA